MAKERENPDEMNNSDETKLRKKFFIKMFEKTLGNISLSCDGAKVPRRTYYYWKNNDSEFKQAIEDVLERNLDFAESQLLKNIKNGKEQSLMFFLKSKGKHRGYVERQEVDNDPEKITLNFNAEPPVEKK